MNAATLLHHRLDRSRRTRATLLAMTPADRTRHYCATLELARQRARLLPGNDELLEAIETAQQVAVQAGA